MPDLPVWQRNYYEHVIRDDAVGATHASPLLERIRAYIAENPARWSEDPENPYRAGPQRATDRATGDVCTPDGGGA